jgi:hypothetical protein
VKHNRIFRRRSYRLSVLRASLRDVTSTARQWGSLFAMRIQPELLRSYILVNVVDDEGYYLVGRIALLVDAVLQGRLPRQLVSHGRYLGFRMKLTAQHRRRDTPEILDLEVVIGPCDGRRPAAYVWLVQPPADPPF